MVTLADILQAIDSKTELSIEQARQAITGPAALDRARPGQLSFLSSPKYRRLLESTQASAVLVQPRDADKCPEGVLAVLVDDPYLAYAQVSSLFERKPTLSGIHPSASIDPSAQLGEGVAIGANAVIGPNVILGDRVQVGPGTVLESNVTIGEGTVIRANVTIHYECVLGADCRIQSGAVIGGDGFGFAPDNGRWHPIAQIGRVVIGDRVEVGSNSTIDRGAIDDTLIDDDVILDNLVQIGHNARIGKGTAFAGQAGAAGSAIVGAGCTVGGQTGIGGHIEIVDNSHFTGQAMVAKGTTKPGLYSSGIPAMSNKDWRRLVVRLGQLESMQSRLQELERKLSGETGE